MLNGKHVRIRTIKEADIEVYSGLVNDIDSQGEFLPATLISDTKLRAQYA